MVIIASGLNEPRGTVVNESGVTKSEFYKGFSEKAPILMALLLSLQLEKEHDFFEASRSTKGCPLLDNASPKEYHHEQT